MDILNILKSVVRICRFSLKMMTCCINITKFGTRLRKLNIKFHSEPIYDKKYIKVKVREYDGMIKTNFLGDKVLNENMRYTCIACLTIDSVVRKNKKNYPQVYLEEFKYKIKKMQMPRFVNAELESEPESELESEFVNELMAELKSNSDSE